MFYLLLAAFVAITTACIREKSEVEVWVYLNHDNMDYDVHPLNKETGEFGDGKVGVPDYYVFYGKDGNYVNWIRMITEGRGRKDWPLEKISEKDYFDYFKGKNSYELWLVDVSNGLEDLKTGELWPKDKISKKYYYLYLQGFSGKDGIDGKTPFIGDNGNWWVGDTDTGQKAQGERGEQGIPGSSGQKGSDGKTPVINISENGTWVINGTDTGINAFGDKGDKGDDGDSAYVLWIVDVVNGEIDWPEDEVTMEDFWRYLKGKDGKDGEPGESFPYIAIPRDLVTMGTNNTYSDFVFTVNSNYEWIYRFINTQSFAEKWEDYIEVRNVNYSIPSGSMALRLKQIPNKEIRFELRFESKKIYQDNSVHESMLIVIPGNNNN